MCILDLRHFAYRSESGLLVGSALGAAGSVSANCFSCGEYCRINSAAFLSRSSLVSSLSRPCPGGVLDTSRRRADIAALARSASS